MAQHNTLGKEGEAQAVQHLIQNGYTVLETNWRYQKAEIDIIALKNNVLAAVEVKTRSSIDFGLPQEFVKPKKIQLLVKALNHYITENDLNVEVRFDIIAVLHQNNSYSIEHIEEAFYYF